MLPNSVTVSTPAGNAIALKKRSEQNGRSYFTGSYVDGSRPREVELEVKHTRPVDKTKKGSSLFRFTIHRYNADGSFEKTVRVWTVAESASYNAAEVEFTAGVCQQFLDEASIRDEFFEGSY